MTRLTAAIVITVTYATHVLALDDTIPADAVTQSNLSSLVDGSSSLISPDGNYVFDNFQIGGSSAPQLGDLTITTMSDGNTGSLLFQIPGDYRILTPPELLDLTISFEAVNLMVGSTLRSSTLDARGATLGTSGAGSVEILQAIFDEKGLLISEMAIRDLPAGPDSLLATTSFVGNSQWKMTLDIQASPGMQPGSVAVLSDFSTSFVASSIPEPSGCVLAVLSMFAPLIARKLKLIKWAA